MKITLLNHCLRLHPVFSLALLASLVLSCQAQNETKAGAKPDPKAGNEAKKAATADGDDAWLELMKALQPPPPPAEWEKKEPGKEQIAEWEKKNGVLAGQAADKAKEFYTRFPDHPKAADAHKMELQLVAVSVQLGNTNRAAQLKTLEEARLKDPKLTEDERFELRVRQVMRGTEKMDDANKAASLAVVEQGARGLQKEFPKREEVYQLLMSLAEAQLDMENIEKSRALTQEVAGQATGETKDMAAALGKKLDRLGKPLKLKFAGLDGQEFDLARLEGKVVLIDFWATWCAPCRAALPDVKATYDKLKGKGFEIVGISFDKTKETLTQFVADEKLAWPQYFDGLGWENKLGTEYGVTSIPAMWLVDKKGNLRSLNAREGLQARVEKLLAEK